MNNSSTDWAYLQKFQQENEVLKRQSDENRIVFIGDSIIAGWNIYPFFIENPHFINRGINGQTTSQILHRFHQDVIDLNPKYVVILAGTNDVAENLGPVTLEQIKSNFNAMIALATEHKIKVILCSVLPVTEYYWNKKIQSFEKIKYINDFLAQISTDKNLLHVDFYEEFSRNHLINPQYSSDGVHPNKEGYEIISTIFVSRSSQIV